MALWPRLNQTPKIPHKPTPEHPVKDDEGKETGIKKWGSSRNIEHEEIEENLEFISARNLPFIYYSMRHVNGITIKLMAGRSTAVITTNGGWTKYGG